jgi:hypothetical protein
MPTAALLPEGRRLDQQLCQHQALAQFLLEAQQAQAAPSQLELLPGNQALTSGE